MKAIGNLEMHAWHGCNLSCESCAHYSSLGVRGGPSADQCRTWMAAWSGRLRPQTFSIVGGEPTANRELADIVEAAIAHWPDSQIRVATNGLLLHRHPRLPAVMGGCERAFLAVSSHHSSDEYQARFAPVRELVADWKARYGLKVRIVEADRYWTRRYEADPSELTFYDSEPRKAWEACVGKSCIQLYEGRIWKCPPVAYFDLAARVRHVPEDARAKRARYLPLEAGCSDAELDAFFAKEEEEICSICPETLEFFALPSPLKRPRRRH